MMSWSRNDCCSLLLRINHHLTIPQHSVCSALMILTFFSSKVKNCSVGIVDDRINEPVEFFYVWLTQPKGSNKTNAAVGNQVKVKVTIINPEDGTFSLVWILTGDIFPDFFSTMWMNILYSDLSCGEFRTCEYQFVIYLSIAKYNFSS